MRDVRRHRSHKRSFLSQSTPVKTYAAQPNGVPLLSQKTTNSMRESQHPLYSHPPPARPVPYPLATPAQSNRAAFHNPHAPKPSPYAPKSGLKKPGFSDIIRVIVQPYPHNDEISTISETESRDKSGRTC
jgi:hypothetical protein